MLANILCQFSSRHIELCLLFTGLVYQKPTGMPVEVMVVVWHQLGPKGHK